MWQTRNVVLIAIGVIAALFVVLLATGTIAISQRYISQILIGVSVSSILVIAATGLAIIFGVAGVINMAHGQFIMVGAYTAAVVGQLGGNTFLAIPVAFAVVASFEVPVGLVDRLVYVPFVLVPLALVAFLETEPPAEARRAGASRVASGPA